MSTVASRLQDVRAQVEKACVKAGRNPEEVTLLAVSKLQPDSLIREAHAAGQVDFGENYAQELRDKAKALTNLSALRWHAIGPLQTNKAKYVAEVAFAFHALDRAGVAEELSRRRKDTLPPLRCFLEVNLAQEETKSGVVPEGVEALLHTVRALPRLEVVGLMALPPLDPDEGRTRARFATLRELAHRHGLRELSMGTTADFALAIAEGATVVRVGTAIFGERPAAVAPSAGA